MVDYTPRHPERFTNDDASVVYTYPVDGLSWEPVQPFRPTLARVSGASFGHDYAQGLPWARDFGQHAIRWELWNDNAQDNDDAFDAAVAGLVGIGAGKLWTIDESAVRRWCYAKLEGLPEKVIDPETLFAMGVNSRMIQLSDWFGESLQTVTETAVVASPHEFVVINDGNAPARYVSIRLRANGAAGFTTPQLINLTNGYQWTSGRTADDADSDVLVDAWESFVGWSTNNGADYADDYANLTLGSLQVPFFELAPGSNLIRYVDGGSPDVDIVVAYYDTFYNA